MADTGARAVSGSGSGAATSVASFNGPDGNPPYYGSSGNGSDEDEVVFYYQGTWTEFAPGSAVPVEDARAAMTSFFAGGQLPGEISWTETGPRPLAGPAGPVP